MLRVDPSLFSNVVSAVQRTSSLPGGAVRGLPGGAVIEGLPGVNSFGSDIADAKKEFELGRVHSALDRVRQIETQFNGVAGRWNGTVGSIISSTRQGNQKLPLQKLNEAKTAQTKMQQLTGPAIKAFRDLTLALEHAISEHAISEQAISAEGRPAEDDDESGVTEAAPDKHELPETTRDTKSEGDAPDIDLLGNYATNYRFGPKLRPHQGPDGKTRVEPKIQPDKFYFLRGFEPPRVVRIREVRRQAVLVFDTDQLREVLIETSELKKLMASGIWILESKSSTN